MLNDANAMYHDVVLFAGDGLAGNSETIARIYDSFVSTCPRDSTETPQTLRSQILNVGNNVSWTALVSPMVKGLICKKEPVSGRSAVLIRNALSIGKKMVRELLLTLAITINFVP